MKISNELLSWVFGCQCEFKYIDDFLGIVFLPVTMDDHEITMEIKGVFFTLGLTYINLDTFIRLAKVKAWENNYEIREGYSFCAVTKIESFDNSIQFITSECEQYDTVRVVGCLEYVCNEVQILPQNVAE